MQVPFHRPDITSVEIAAAGAALESGWLTSGKWVDRLEAMVCELTGAKHAIAVNSATTGMMLATAWKMPKGHTASVPALGGHFAANAVRMAGANQFLRPVDCDDDLTTGKWFGDLSVVADYGGRAQANSRPSKEGRFLLCDSAYSLGGTGRDGKPIGTQADAHVFSLQATKQITCGEGGIITTEIDELATWLRRARCHGMDADAHTRTGHGYDIVFPGGAFMLPDILAAVAVVQMETAEKRRQRRFEIRLRYAKYLFEQLQVRPHVSFDPDDAHGLHVLRIKDQVAAAIPHPGGREYFSPCTRDSFIEKMAERGVSCKVHYPYLPSLTAYKHLQRGDSPNAERAAAEVVSLPLYSGLTDEQVEHVCVSAKEVLAELEASQ